MKVYKFGGASVRHAEGVRNLLNIVRDENELFVIVSAMGKTTNALEEVFDAMRKGDTAFCESKIADGTLLINWQERTETRRVSSPENVSRKMRPSF